MIVIRGKVYTDEILKERKRILGKEFKGWQPSLLQKLFWLIWPTQKMIRWQEYINIRNENPIIWPKF